MKKTQWLIFILLLTISVSANAQWSTNNQLSDLNSWSSSPGYFSWYGTGSNTPNGEGYGSGIQMVLAGDNRFGAQIVIPTFDNQLYYRRNQNSVWDSWSRIWSSANLNRSDVNFAALAVNCTNVYATGKIGIGTTSPDEKLTVYGKIHSQEVKVDLSVPGPDYVFEPTYKLPSLADIKIFVDKNRHLPEIPTAAEMAKNGIDLGDMTTKLLKKVEELTLYLIEKDKEVKTQQTINDSQQKEIDELKKQVSTLIKSKE